MENFLVLNYTAKGYIMALYVFGMIILLIALIFHMSEKKNKFSVPAFLLLLVNLLNLSALMVLNDYHEFPDDISLNTISLFANKTPYILHVMLGICTIMFALYSIYALHKKSQNQVGVFSVKEALENLPTGIAFMSNNVNLMLSNHIMHTLSKKLTAKPLQNGLEFWNDLTNLQNSNKCVITGKEPAFALENGDIWQFSKTLCDYSGNEYYQLKATNITELYNLKEGTKTVNEKLAQQQYRLKKLTDIIEENAEKQVAVNMKIDFHDNFGNLLTLTKKTLRESEDIDEAKTLFEYWGNLSNMITALSSGKNQNLTLEQIMLFAQKLGSKIVITGELPKDNANKASLLLCINEMLKNAYRHADAHILNVDISHTKSNVTFTIHNETKSKITQITEGGGLTGLRQIIEQAGGEMVMDCSDGVKMTVKLYNQCGEGELNV